MEKKEAKSRAYRLTPFARSKGLFSYLLIRLLVLGGLLSVALYVQEGIEPFSAKLTLLAILPGSLSVLTLSSLAWVRTKGSSTFFACLQFPLDLFYITALIYITGGPISPFLFMYIPLVMASAILHSRNAALTMTVAATMTYATLAWSMLNAKLLPLDVNMAVHSPAGGLLVQVLGLVSAMALISVATSFLVERIYAGDLMFEKSQRDLSELNNRQRLLMDGLAEGVITTDVEDKIVFINSAAIKLLKLNPEDFIGEKFNLFLQKIDADHGGSVPDEIIPGQRYDITTVEAKGREPLHIVFYSQSIVGDGALASGTIYTFQDVTRLRTAEDQLAMQERMAKLLSEQSQPISSGEVVLDDFVGETPVMRQIFKLIEKVSLSNATVLISGQSGTGKELVARAIHSGSKRSNQSFVAVNCGAIPENLIESELFGHQRGAFTGAESDYSGLFRQADQGTIFLDEIGELPLQMQSKLLRVIQEKKVRPVGGEKDIPLDVRIISATNKNLKEEVEKGDFREDLFYRLNVVNIRLPSLSQRKDDIPLLVKAILAKTVSQQEEVVMSPQAMQLLMQYEYRGNVRELENILERALVLGGSVILPEHLPDYVQVASPAPQRSITQIIIDEELELPVDLDKILESFERRYLEAALQRSKGVKKNAANLLGMNFRSFRYRLQKFGMG